MTEIKYESPMYYGKDDLIFYKMLYYKEEPSVSMKIERNIPLPRRLTLEAIEALNKFNKEILIPGNCVDIFLSDMKAGMRRAKTENSLASRWLLGTFKNVPLEMRCDANLHLQTQGWFGEYLLDEYNRRSDRKYSFDPRLWCWKRNNNVSWGLMEDILNESGNPPREEWFKIFEAR